VENIITLTRQLSTLSLRICRPKEGSGSTHSKQRWRVLKLRRVLHDATGYNCRNDRCCTCSGSSVAAPREQRAGSGLWASSVRHGPIWPLPARIT
jgi:hypothetical protein